MKTTLLVILSGTVGILFGFISAAFFQALGQMSREEESRHTQPDPWNEIVHPHDKFNDDININ